jgi:hypothetical protein
MDMKHILQALDKSSSRKIEGANDMHRFVSIVHENNTLKKVTDKVSSAVDTAKEKLSDFRPYDEKAVAKMYGVKTKEKNEDYDLDEAGKPGDPGFKPTLQVPQAPPFPEGDFSQPGPYDLGNGEKLTVNQDGTRVHSSGAGTFTYDKAGKAIKYATPMVGGFSQEHDLVTGNITVSYMKGPLKVVHTYDKTGKQTGDSTSEYDMGTQTVAQKRTAGGAVQNTVTPAGGATQPAPAPEPVTEGKKTFADYLLEASKKCNHTAKGKSCPMHGLDECGAYEEDISEVAGPENCWPGHRKVGTKPGTGKNKGKRVNDCEKI